MALNIGVNVLEVTGSGAPAIVGAPASVAAFNILTRRGVPNRPARVTSFPKFVELFGGQFAGGQGAYLVKGFFDNGGHTAWINRVVATDAAAGAAPAAVTLRDSANQDTLTLQGGFRGAADPGTWADGLRARVQASETLRIRLREDTAATVTGAALVEPIDMSAFPSLSIRIDGQTTPTVLNFQASNFTNAAQATRIEIRDAINQQTNALEAVITAANELELTSTGAVAGLNNGWTSLQVTAANATLGMTQMANPAFGAPDPATVTTTSLQLARVDDFHVGDAVQISDQVAGGPAGQSAMVKILTINVTNRTISWTPAIANINAYVPRNTRVRRVEFALEIYDGGTEARHLVESMSGLSMESDVANYAPRRLNDRLLGSRYVRATDANSPSAAGADVPVAGTFPFQPGRDGTPVVTDFVGDEAQRTGFHAFDAQAVQLVTCERTDTNITRAGINYCQARGDCMYVGAVPQHTVGAGQAETYGQSFQGANVYAALYGPWVQVTDPIGQGANPTRWINPVGHVMGVYARVETTRGIWKAPAGDEADLRGVLDVEYNLSDREHTNLVKNGSVNGIRAVPRSGIIIDASRTLSTDTRWLYVNVRLLFNYVKVSLRDGLRWVRQEPNRSSLWNIVKFNSVTPFLMGLWRQGAFGTGTPDQVFTVIADETNNPPEDVDQGFFRVEVYFYPSKPAETIVIIVGQQPFGGVVTES
jgi:hypothetical protein